MYKQKKGYKHKEDALNDTSEVQVIEEEIAN